MRIFALDIGGTKIASAIVIDGVMGTPSRVKTPLEKEDFLKSVISLVPECDRVAVALPGYTAEDGTVLFAGQVLSFLAGTPLKRILEKKLKVPVSIHNDADCFTLAEHTLDTTSYRTLGVIWGSGVGFGLVQGHPPVFPVGSRIELGHEPYQGRTLESFAGGVANERRYFHATGKKKTISQIYASTDARAKKQWEEMFHAMTDALITATLAFAPDQIVLGGGLSNLPIIKKLQHAVKEKLPEGFTLPKIRRYKIADDAGLLGAAQLSGL